MGERYRGKIRQAEVQKKTILSLHSFPVIEFYHEINFLLITQAGGDTDKMETCRREFIYDKDDIYFGDEKIALI